MSNKETTEERLKIRIHRDVFLMDDERVRMLASSRISHRVFVSMIRQEDPLMLIGDTVYLLTEAEYYAMRPKMPLVAAYNVAYEKVTSPGGTDGMSKEDAEYVALVKKEASECSSCAMKRYKASMYRLAKKYGIQLDVPEFYTEGEYPKVTGTPIRIASELIDHPYSIVRQSRTECLDCVEKHVAQAWVLSCEFVQGYDDYMPFIVGHLAEAFDECPRDLPALRETLEFCIAKCNREKDPFVPVTALIKLVHASRNMTGSNTQQDTAPTMRGEFSIEFTDEMRDELESLPKGLRTDLKSNLELVSGVASDPITWQGVMAVSSDLISHICPRTARMLRNRRVLFVGAPETMDESGYGMGPILEALDGA
jgi:phage-related protein